MFLGGTLWLFSGMDHKYLFQMQRRVEMVRVCVCVIASRRFYLKCVIGGSNLPCSIELLLSPLKYSQPQETVQAQTL